MGRTDREPVRMQRNYSVDILRFLCAYLVITLHIHTPYSAYTEPIARCAVPLFFMMSGFFGKAKIYRLLKIIVLSTLVYLFVNILPPYRRNKRGLALVENTDCHSFFQRKSIGFPSLVFVGLSLCLVAHTFDKKIQYVAIGIHDSAASVGCGDCAW